MSWGRGFEIIKDAFTADGLEIPTFKEEFGGVTVVIKREIFQAIQQGKAAGADKPLRAFFIWITNIVTLSVSLVLWSERKNWPNVSIKWTIWHFYGDKKSIIPALVPALQYP